MNTTTKINYAWLAVGIIFGIIGIIGLLGGDLGAILTLAISGLIIWTTAHNMGGWENLMWDIKKQIRLLGK